MTEKQKGACPYALPLQMSDDEDSTTNEVIEMAKKSCPAFVESNSCPFKDAKSQDDIRQALLLVPSSHLASSGPLHKALGHLHKVNKDIDANDTGMYRLPGGCPIKDRIGATIGEDGISFGEAMEEFSLAAIMAKMAEGLEEEEEEVDTKSKVKPADDDSKNLPETESPETSNYEDSKHDAPSTTKVAGATKRPSGLAEALKAGTAVSHQAAEDVHFVRNFIRGKIDRTLYAELVLSLHHVYSALEEELDAHASQHFASLHFPKELSRQESLEDDLDFWKGGSSKNQQMKMSPATQDYVDRIHHVAETDPLLLLSHAYTRYLGDLSGGKILARVARKAMNLDKDGSGLRFYEFEHIQNAKNFKDEYRRSLDELNLTSVEVSKLVSEANVAFVLNMRIFEELDVIASVPGARVRKVEEAFAYALQGSAATDPGGDAAKCPFANVNTTPQVAPTSKPNLGERCPWPFVFFHDPKQGLRDWQTWLATWVGLIVATYHTASDERCPWPFIFAHDKRQAMQDWQTWTLIGSVIIRACLKTESSGEQFCPWPFVFFHDPKQGMQNWKTWMTIGLLMCWAWSRIQT